jgi:hypothetical protein
MRKIQDEQDARRCLKAAGSDPVRWARAHGVDGRSLSAWRINLAGRAARTGRQTAQLVELIPLSSPGARYVIAVGDVRVEFDDGCSGETLSRVLQVLRSC